MELERIPYRDGYIYVDRSATLQEKDLVYKSLSDKKLHYLDDFGLFLHNNKSSGDGYLKVVAQSIANPEYIGGIAFVEEPIRILAEKLAEAEYPPYQYLGDGKADIYTGLRREGYVKGFLERTTGFEFSQQDMENALSKAFQAKQEGHEITTAEIIKSIRDESEIMKVDSIVIEMEDVMEHNPKFATPDWIDTIPKTYQKDGKTFLKILKILQCN